MTDSEKTGLPADTDNGTDNGTDTGNHMSDRAGYYDESEGSPAPSQTDNLGSDEPAPLDGDHSGTSFDAGDAIPGR